MSVLSAADIAELRATVAGLFPDRADIYHVASSGSSEWGGSGATFPGAPSIPDVPVLFGTQSAQEQQRLASIGVSFDLALTFPGGTDIRLSDRIKINDPSAVATTDALVRREILADNPYNYLPLSEPAGPIAANLGANVDGMIAGGVVRGAQGPPLVGAPTAFRFDGTTGYVRIMTAARVVAGEAWFNTAVRKQQPLLSTFDAQANGAYFGLNAQGALFLYTFLLHDQAPVTGDASMLVDPQGRDVTGGWHHASFSVALDPTTGVGTLDVELDGQLWYRRNVTRDAFYAEKLLDGWIGHDLANNDFFDGSIAHAASYQVPVPLARFAAHYRAGQVSGERTFEVVSRGGGGSWEVTIPVGVREVTS